MIEQGSRFDPPDLTIRLVQATNPQDALFNLGLAIGCIDKDDVKEFKESDGENWQKELLNYTFSDETIGRVFAPTGESVWE